MFSREIVTDDTMNDVSLDVPRFWIWATGPYVDGEFTFHGSTRGVSNGRIQLPSPNECLGKHIFTIISM